MTASRLLPLLTFVAFIAAFLPSAEARLLGKRGWGSNVTKTERSEKSQPARKGFFDRRKAKAAKTAAKPKPAKPAPQVAATKPVKRTAKPAPTSRPAPTRVATRTAKPAPSVSRVAKSTKKPERKRLLARIFAPDPTLAAAARPTNQRALSRVEPPKKKKTLPPGAPNANQSAPKINHGLIAKSSKSQASVTVNIGRQRAYVYIGGQVAVDTPISTARPGKRTPRGTFRVGERVAQGKISTIYHVSMPYWMRLGSSMYGMHAGYLPGYPASAGCIRMPYSAAQAVYKSTGHGTRVKIY